ncbi:MFS transporter [Pararobbsia alpina]|uniref:4-hydroxybenzoate transporter PcaK n=1 Tax=Pararobbsia alpina TaxID=621374 RepID=A0A6S7BE14_9BURK|nr:MFS transporter [Pararobbsia alpina]CAB3796285.1 4-hydroxybenzoate transporter PcaK [Pararobbsia alpina]
MALVVDVGDLIDTRPLGRYRLLVLMLCAICLVMDGFDVQAIGYVAPAVIHEWGIAKEVLSPVFGAGLFGMLIGSLILSAAGDKVGRRPVLIGAMLFFSVCMFATGFVHDIPEFIALRFAAGLGLGGIMPNVTALIGEFSPKRIRMTSIMTVSVGYIVGGVVGGFIAAALMPVFGWQSVFFFGGVISLVVAVLLWVSLPESVQFLLLRKNDEERVRRLLARIVGSAEVISASARLIFNEQKSQGAPFIEIFKDGRASITILLWIINFTNLLDMYFLSNWLPTVMHEAGHSVETAALAGSALWGGGLVGTLALGRVTDRFGVLPVLASAFLIGVAATAAIGNPLVMTSLGAVFLAIFLSGFAIIGGHPGINAWSATYYPTDLRSTGIGWSLGVGRIGSVIGPVVGGALMHLQWTSSSLFMVAAMFVCVTLAGIVAIHFVDRPMTGRTADAL